MTTNTNDNQPVKQFRSINGISASIWKRKTKEGEVYYTASIDRSYKDKDEKWQRTSNFRLDELNIVRRLVIKAEAFIDDLMREGAATE